VRRRACREQRFLELIGLRWADARPEATTVSRRDAKLHQECPALRYADADDRLRYRISPHLPLRKKRRRRAALRLPRPENDQCGDGIVLESVEEVAVRS
jgi:hypothetical protein